MATRVYMSTFQQTNNKTLMYVILFKGLWPIFKKQTMFLPLQCLLERKTMKIKMVISCPILIWYPDLNYFF